MTPVEYKQFIINELQKIKSDEYRLKKNAYAREYNKTPKAQEWRRNYNAKYWAEYKQRPEYIERARKRAHNKWIEHRQKIHNNNSKEKLRPNYKYESYCSKCERVRPKGYRCPKCNYMMKNGRHRNKEDVFRY